MSLNVVGRRGSTSFALGSGDFDLGRVTRTSSKNLNAELAFAGSWEFATVGSLGDVGNLWTRASSLDVWGIGSKRWLASVPGSGPRCLLQTLRYRLKYIVMICKTLKLECTICYKDKDITRRGWLWKMGLLHETICQCSFSFSSIKSYALFGGKVSNFPRVA